MMNFWDTGLNMDYMWCPIVLFSLYIEGNDHSIAQNNLLSVTMFPSQFCVFLNAVQGEKACWISDACVNIIIYMIILVKQTVVPRPSGS